MTDTIHYEAVESKIIEIRGQKVIIDGDIAELYGVETKRINEAVNRNSEKFPEGYLFELTKAEKVELVANCDRLNFMKHSAALPKAFTEKGLYMLATILKSPKATQTTLAIIDTFSKVREMGRIVNQLPAVKENSPEHQKLMQRAGEIISELILPDNIEKNETEASLELNLALVKLKYSVKRKSKN